MQKGSSQDVPWSRGRTDPAARQDKDRSGGQERRPVATATAHGGNLSSPEDQRVEDGSIGGVGHDKWAGRICTGLMLPAPSRLAAGGTPRPQRSFGQGK